MTHTNISKSWRQPLLWYKIIIASTHSLSYRQGVIHTKSYEYDHKKKKVEQRGVLNTHQYGSKFRTFPQHPGAHSLGCTMFIRQPKCTFLGLHYVHPTTKYTVGTPVSWSVHFLFFFVVFSLWKNKFWFFAFVWEVHFPADNSDLGFGELSVFRGGKPSIVFSKKWSNHGRKTGPWGPIRSLSIGIRIGTISN